MSFHNRRLLLSLVVLVALAVSVIAFTPAIPKVHAGVNTPALFIQPATQPLAAAGSSVIFNVNVANMSTFAGWNIYVRTNPTILTPASFVLGTFMPSGFESVHCINNAGSSCDLSDGPGVVHSGFASFGFAAGSGTLFTITYTAVAGPGTKVSFPEAATNNNGLNSLLDTSGFNITGVPEIGGIYGSVSNPTSTTVNCGTSPVAIGGSVTCTATVTDTSATPSTPAGTVTFTSNGAGTFTGSPCTLVGSGATSTCSVTYSPSAVGTGTHTITATYSPDAAHSASSGTTTVTVTTPALTADFTSSPAHPIIGGTVTFTSTVTGGTTPYTYAWNFGDGTTSTVANPTHAYTTAGTFTVTLTVTDSSTPTHLTATATHTVTVASPVVATFTSSPAHPIIGGTVTFTSTVTGGTTPYTYSWTFGDGGTSTVANPTHAYATAGTFTVTLTVTDSSTPTQLSTTTNTVTVASPVVATFTSSPAHPIIGGTVTFTSTVTGGTAPYVYSWTFGDGTTSTVANPTHAYATAGTFTVTLTVTDSSTPTQSSTATNTVTVASPVVATFTSSPAHPIIGGTVTFTSTVTGGTTPYTYSWTFGDGGTSTVANPTHAYATSGVFTVTLVVTDSSTPAQSSTATNTVTVAAPVVAAFTSSPAHPIIGGTVTFTSTVTGGTTPYVYAWTFGDGATSAVANPTHAYATAGTFTVTLTVTDSSTPAQTSTVTHTVTVASPVVATFTSSPAHPIIGGTVTFTSTVTGGTTPYVYSWTFGDGATSTVANPTHAYATAGTFTVTLTVTDSSTPTQSSTATNTVTVASPVVATFTSSPAHPIIGGTVTFTSTVTGGTTPYTYSWTFGDGGTSTVANPTHAYATSGTFTVTLTVTDSSTPTQSSTATNTVTVAAPVVAAFTSSPAHPIIGGTVTFTSTVTGGTTPFVYAWTFGDGGTSAVANPTHAYTTAGTFTVTLTVTDSSTPTQTGTVSHTVTVASPVVATFTSSPAHPIIGGTVTFTSTVTGGTTPYVYSWAFGDGATSTVANPTHAYATAGTFTVTLTVTDSSTPTQSSTATNTVTVASPVVATFTSSPAHPIIGGTVTFTSTVSGGTTPYTYAWTFGDGATSTVANPTHAYATAGTFTVTLTVTDSSTPTQSSTATNTVTVASPVVAAFTSSPAHPIIGGTVTFTSTVTGGTTPYTYSWTFGDGSTSTVANPTHAYATAGTFTVTLTVTDSSTPAQTSTVTHTVTVASPVVATFTSSPAHPIIGGTVTFTSTVSGGTTPYTYAWNFGDGATSTVANPTHAYATAGTFTVTLTVTDSSTPTQSSTTSGTVTVATPVVATFTSSPAHPIIGGTVTFTSTVTGGTTPYVYAWTFGDGATSAVANPTHAYATAGTFTVTLTVTDSSTPTQSATATNTVTVASAVTVNFTASPAAPTIGQTVTFTSTVTGGTTPYTYSWTFGDGATSTVANPTHAYAAAGTFTVTLTVTDSSTPTQSATVSHTVTVSSGLSADFTSSPAHPIIGGTVTFTSVVAGGTAPFSYSWTFGDGATSTVANPTHAYATSGNFTVTLTVTDSSTPVQSKTATHFVVVASAVTANFTSSPAAPTIGQTVTFTSTVTGGTTPYTYSWTFGDAGTSNVANPTHAYSTAGTFTVTLTVTDSSTPAQSATATHTVTVSAGLAANFTSSPAHPIIGGTVTFTSTVTGGTTPYVYSWTFGDGGTSTVANPTHAYATAGTFTVTLTVTDSSTPVLSSTVTHTVTVASPVVADFTSSPAHPIIGGIVTFTSTVTGGTTPYAYAWTFGDGSTSAVASPTHAYTTAGTFTVTLTVTDSSTPTQSATASHTVTVASPVVANFTSSPANPIIGGTVTFTSTVSGGTAPYTYAWTFGDGSTSNVANPTHVYATAGTFTVTLTVTDSSTPAQTATATHTVTVTGLLAADFTSSPAHPIIGGTVSFTSTVTGGTTPYVYAWTFGDGATSTVANPTHAYATAGTFTVTLTVTDASTPTQTATATHTVTVASALAADFTFSPAAPSVGQGVTFTSTVTGGTTPYTYSWTFGDGSTSALANPTHTFATAGIFTVILTVTDSSTPAQSAAASHTVTISARLAVDFTFSPSSPIPGQTITFTSAVTGGTAPFTYSWTFGDGATSTVANPTHTYATGGAFTVTLTVTDSSTPTQTATATHVVSFAGADFSITANPTSVGPLVPANASDGLGGTNAFPNATSIITVSALNGFTGTITLSLAPSAGLNAFLNVTSITLTSTKTTGGALLTLNSNLAGNYVVTITGQSGTISHSATVSVSVVDFTLGANPLTIGPLRPNQTGSSTITVTGLNGITTTVAVSRNAGGTTSSLTLGSCSLSPTTTTCTGTLTASADVPGVYQIIVDATSNVAVSGGRLGANTVTVDHQVVVTVIVQDFAISANPTTIGPQSPGATGTSTITVTALQGFTGTVCFVLTPSSAHVTASITPTCVTFTSGGPTALTATLSVSFDQIGTYGVIVNGTSTGYPSHSVRVHVISAATILISPQSQGLAAPGSTVSYNVNFVSMPTFAGYDISVQTNNAVLSPNSIDTSGSTIPGLFETVNCVNGGFYANGTAIPSGMPGNLNCGASDGPGIAHSAGTSTSGFVSGDGLLFTINYVARAADFSISASPTVVSNLGAGQTGTSTITVSTVTPSSTAVTIFNDVIMDTNGGTIAHTTQNGSYGVSSFTVSLTLTPSAGLTASITPTSVTLSSATPTATATLSFSAATAGNYTVLVTGTASGLPNAPSHGVMVNVQVTDFTITANPSTIAPPQGVNSGSSTITVTGLNGFTGTVTLTLTTSPGLTASINPTTITLSATVTSSTATLQVSATASGTYTVMVTGSSPGFQSRTVRVTVIITSGADFKLSASPNLITASNEDQDEFSSRITVTSIGSFAGTVCLTAVESPNGGLGPTLSPTCVTVTAGGTAFSTLRFSVQQGETNPGTYIITVTGTSGSLTHTTTVTVQVPSSQVRISVSSLRTVSLSANGGVQKWTVTITNRAHNTEYVNVVISGSTSSGTHGFTESKLVAVGSRSTVTIVITHTFTAADVGQSFNYTAVGMFGTSPTNLNQVTFPRMGHFRVVA